MNSLSKAHKVSVLKPLCRKNVASFLHSGDKLWWVFVPYSHWFSGQGKRTSSTRVTTLASPTSMGYPPSCPMNSLSKAHKVSGLKPLFRKNVAYFLHSGDKLWWWVLVPYSHWFIGQGRDIFYTSNYSSVPHQHGGPPSCPMNSLPKAHKVSGLKQLKKCGVFSALWRQAMVVGVSTIFPLVQWTRGGHYLHEEPVCAQSMLLTCVTSVNCAGCTGL